MLGLPSPTKALSMRRDSLVDVVPGLFDTKLLEDEVAVGDMICSLERHFADHANDLDDTLAQLAQAGLHTLEFVLSGM